MPACSHRYLSSPDKPHAPCRTPSRHEYCIVKPPLCERPCPYSTPHDPPFARARNSVSGPPVPGGDGPGGGGERLPCTELAVRRRGRGTRGPSPPGRRGEGREGLSQLGVRPTELTCLRRQLLHRLRGRDGLHGQVALAVLLRLLQKIPDGVRMCRIQTGQLCLRREGDWGYKHSIMWMLQRQAVVIKSWGLSCYQIGTDA